MSYDLDHIDHIDTCPECGGRRFHTCRSNDWGQVKYESVCKCNKKMQCGASTDVENFYGSKDIWEVDNVLP